MKLTVCLFVQKHENRTYTVSVPSMPGVASYGPTLEECKQEIIEELEGKLPDAPADVLHYVAQKPNQSLEHVTVMLYPSGHHGRRRRESFKLTVSLMLIPQDDGQILVVAPRLQRPPLSFFITKPEELQEIAQVEIAQYFYDEPLERIILHQAARRETLDSITVEFKPKKAKEREEEDEESDFWALKQSGVNLSAQATEGQLRRAFRREKEVEQLLTSIASQRCPSIVLIGANGVGKTAIVHEVARRVRHADSERNATHGYSQ